MAFTKNGLDCMSNVANLLASNGYSFVGRYYNTINTSKNLTLSEAQTLSNAGIVIIPVWENGYPTSSSYFSYNKGVSDATAALNYAKNTIGQPHYTNIYFAVDYDASIADITGCINQYFKGITTIFSNEGHYRPGVYGSGAVCKYIRNNFSTVNHSWLAKSTGWSGYNAYASSCDVKQGEGITFHGLSCDTDYATNIYGGGFTL